MNWQIIEKIMPRGLYHFCSSCLNNLRIARAHYLVRRHQTLGIHSDKKIHIVFIVQRTEVFNSVRTVFEAAVASEDCQVYLLPLPRCAYGRKELRWDTYESVVGFCRQLSGGMVINTYDFETKEYYDLTKLIPDYIFLNVPYTQEYPDIYSIDQLALIAKICYVPYGFTMPNEKKYFGLYSSSFFANLMKYISLFFADGKASYYYCKKNRMWLRELLFGKCLYNIGYPRFDTIDAHEIGTMGNTILWLPRWTAAEQTDNGNLGSHFFDYNNHLLKYIDGQDYYNLIIRPHPLMFENYIKCGLMSEQDVVQYQVHIEQNEKISLDKNPSYEDSFNMTDILITDYSSLIIEYFLRGKPVIYCGRREDLSPRIMHVTESFYYVNGWGELKKVLDDLKAGIDPLKDVRNNAVQKFREQTKDAGERILRVLKEDYMRSGNYNASMLFS